jgi:hypothetical protein
LKSSQLILTAVVLAASTTLAAEYLQHKPVRYGRTLTGAIGVGIGLSLIDAGSPQVAEGLAYLIIVSSVLVNGGPIFAAVSKGVK